MNHSSYNILTILLLLLRIGINLLEELTKQLRSHVSENITTFVQNRNTNIVLVSY